MLFVMLCITKHMLATKTIPHACVQSHSSGQSGEGLVGSLSADEQSENRRSRGFQFDVSWAVHRAVLHGVDLVYKVNPRV